MVKRGYSQPLYLHLRTRHYLRSNIRDRPTHGNGQRRTRDGAGGGKHNYGSDVTLTANADAYYHVVQWSDGNTDNPRIFLLVEDITLTAEFAEDISEQTTSEIKTLKVLRNGLVYIIREGNIYDLNGRRVR